MILTYRFRLYPNKLQTALLDKSLNLCKDFYNSALEHRILLWKYNKIKINYYDQAAEIKNIRNDFVEYKNVHYNVLQNVLKRLDQSFSRFFKHGGFPRFKSINRFKTIEFYSGFKLVNKKLRVSKIGDIKIKLSRPIDGNIKQLKITKNNLGQWYACFVCDVVKIIKSEELGGEIGIDLGISEFVTTSSSEKIHNPRFINNSINKIKLKQKKLSNKINGSKGYKKSRITIAKIHNKIKNQRNDFLHKTANYLLSRYGKIYLEKLNIGAMVSKRRDSCLNRNILDASWGKFINILTYKAESADKKVVFVDPKNTSKACSNCLSIKEDLDLSDRIYKCDNCNLEINRDLNAACNILRVGQALVAAKA